jgi:tape measure domain-containing protein
MESRMGGLGSLLFDVGASTVTLQSDLARGEAMTTAFVNSVNVELARVGAGANFSAVSDQLKGLTADVSALKAVAATVGIGIGTGLVKEAMDYSDAWLGVSNRIRTTASDAMQVASIQKTLLADANSTGMAVDATAKTYQRLETVLASSGKTQADAQTEAIALTKTLNQEIVVSGANTGEASHAVNDLVHGLAGGVLQARQFNPILRQMPDLAMQIAAGLGVSVKQLEEMVHKGLPAQQVLDALAKQSSTIEERFTALPRTFAQAWTELHNDVEAYVGSAAQANSLTEATKAAIVGLGNNIATVATVIEGAGAATVAWLGGRTLGMFGNLATAAYMAATAQGEYKSAAILSAEADLAAAKATESATAATLAQVAAAAEKKLAVLADAEATVTALTAEQRLLETRLASLPVGVNVIADSARLEEVQTELAVATANLAKAETALTAAFARQDLAYAAAATSASAATVAQAALNAETSAGAIALGGLSRAGSAAFAFIGGWPTLLLAAGAALYYLATAEDDVDKQNAALAKSVKAATDAHGQFTPALERSTAEAFNNAQALQTSLEKQLAAAQAEQAAATGAYDMGGGFMDASAKAAILSPQLAMARDMAAQAAGAFLKAKAAAAGQWVMNILAPDFNVSLAAVEDFNAELGKLGERFKEQAATYKLGHVALVQYKIDQELAKESVGKNAEQIAILSKNLQEGNADTLASARALDVKEASYRTSTKAITDQQRALADYNQDMLKVHDLEEQVSSGLSGPYAAALRSYQKDIDLTAKTWANAVVGGTATKDLLGELSDLQEGLGERLVATNAQIKAQHDVMTPLTEDLQLQQQLLGVLPQYQDAATAGLKAYNAALKANVDLYGDAIPAGQDIKDVLTAQLPLFVQTKQAIHDIGEQQRQNQEVTRQWADIWTQAGSTIGDDIGKVVVEGESLMDDLTNVAKQTVEAIISYFAKLAIINPILNSIFGGAITGGGGSLLPTLAGGVFGGGGGGGLLGGVLGGGADFTSTAAGGTQNSIMQPSSWIMAGKNLFSGFGSGLSTFWNGTGGGFNWSQLGTSDFAEANANNLNMSSVYGAPGSGALGYGGYGSALGQGLGIAGGLYAGYNRFQQGGALGGAAGGLAYGAGTYALGAGLASAAGGAGFAAGVGGAFAIPVVGWIALAAMLIDKFSGGKLFGTDATFNGAQTDLRVGASGADYVSWADLKGQHALFGGSYHETQDIAETQDQKDAAAAFFKALKDGTDQFAHYFGTTAATIVGGTFSTVYDKKGNVKSTSSTVNGITYDGETADQFSERLAAENDIAVLKQIGVDVTSYTNSFIKDADSYSKAVQDVSQAMGMAFDDLKKGIDVGGKGTLQGDFAAIQTYDTDGESQSDTYARLSAELQDVNNGVGLLTGQKTIADIEAFLATAQQFGESLTQTYQRLQQAAAQYNQFVAQFKPQATYVDDYEAALANIKAQYIANVKQANDLAKAAGLAGASTEDLTNIMQLAAKQEADALKQLQASAQSLAFSLGLTTVGSLDDVNSEIARLQQQAGQGATAVGNFGNAMQTAAQQATDAMNLLLGDLSPYNDKAKLQIALQGLYAGTATKDQVLSIGKDLWTTTSSQYQALFNQVMAVPDHGTGGGGGGGAGGAQHQGLSAADSQRLKDLLKEQQALQAAATLQQYQTLAQQVAEIASSKGEDWKQVLTDMNVDIAAFEKGLGMTDDQTNAYIQAAQDAKDSAGENTQTIVYWLQQIVDAVNGRSGAGGMPSDGHSSHARPIINITLAQPGHSRQGAPARLNGVLA